MSKEICKKLAEIAYNLDLMGKYSQADTITTVMRRVSQANNTRYMVRPNDIEMLRANNARIMRLVSVGSNAKFAPQITPMFNQIGALLNQANAAIKADPNQHASNFGFTRNLMGGNDATSFSGELPIIDTSGGILMPALTQFAQQVTFAFTRYGTDYISNNETNQQIHNILGSMESVIQGTAPTQPTQSNANGTQNGTQPNANVNTNTDLNAWLTSKQSNLNDFKTNHLSKYQNNQNGGKAGAQASMQQAGMPPAVIQQALALIT